MKKDINRKKHKKRPEKLGSNVLTSSSFQSALGVTGAHLPGNPGQMKRVSDDDVILFVILLKTSV